MARAGYTRLLRTQPDAMAVTMTGLGAGISSNALRASSGQAQWWYMWRIAEAAYASEGKRPERSARRWSWRPAAREVAAAAARRAGGRAGRRAAGLARRAAAKAASAAAGSPDERRSATAADHDEGREGSTARRKSARRDGVGASRRRWGSEVVAVRSRAVAGGGGSACGGMTLAAAIAEQPVAGVVRWLFPGVGREETKGLHSHKNVNSSTTE